MTEPRRISEAELHAYVDDELAAEDRAEIEAVLANSSGDMALAREFGALNEAIRTHYAYRLAEPVPPPMLRLARQLSLRRGRWLVPGWRALAAGVGIAVIGALAGYALRGRLTETSLADAGLVNTAIGAHTVYVPEVRHPVEVGAAEETHLVQWLTKRIGADIKAPALASLGWKLVGGRLLPDHGHPAAQFMYEDAAGRRLTLYIRKETGLDNTSFRFGERDGFGAFYWIDRPLAYALAGRLSREELLQIATAVYAQLDTAAGGGLSKSK